MVVFNPVKKEIDIKIVYYGPALCGKTSNLQSVHLSLNPDQRGELVSLATKDDRTLFFDFLPIELDNIKGFKTRFHIYTVPGQVLYTLTRKAVLTGVDGIIFVADSEEGKMEENIESLDDLKENLKYYNKDLQTIPFVMQYNKRDLERVISVNELESQLNPGGNPSFEASAISGKGVMETLTMCCKMVLKQIQEKSNTLQQPSSKEKQSQEGTQEVSNELPSLTLVDSHSEAELADTSLPQESPVDASASEAADGNDLLNEETVPVQESEGPGTEQQFINETAEVPSEEGLLNSEPEIQLEPSSSQPEVGESEFLNREQPQDSTSFKDEGLTNDNSNTFSDTSLDSSGMSEDSAPQEEKNTCPRCSLKFKPNVKQCPICKVQLLSAGEQDKEEPSGMVEVPSAVEPNIPEKPDFSLPAEGTNAENGLEIISCGQPSKTSHTAIRVPLTLKINGTGKEITVDVAIDFGNGLLK
jgi:signal recognition particle receptor subunit beta